MLKLAVYRAYMQAPSDWTANYRSTQPLTPRPRYVQDKDSNLQVGQSCCFLVARALTFVCDLNSTPGQWPRPAATQSNRLPHVFRSTLAQSSKTYRRNMVTSTATCSVCSTSIRKQLRTGLGSSPEMLNSSDPVATVTSLRDTSVRMLPKL